MSNTKEQLVLTALKLFMQKGFKEVTMKDIVDISGITKGGVYHYFGSKEQVFAEVIAYFFEKSMITDYSQLPQSSLKVFYNGVFNQADQNRLATEKLFAGQNHDNFSNNYYYLIFDAIRLLPEFKKNHMQHQQEELEVWKSVVHSARINYEIQSGMSNEQIAKLFIYLGDGANINFITSDNGDKREIRILWDGLYDSLKA
jgi:TetR/AcrR family transcriptional repressor of nem operon